MEESVYSQNIYNRFVTDFKSGWIDSMDWCNGEKRKSLLYGVTKIKEFIPFVFSNASKLVLSGDHLRYSVDKIGDIEGLLEGALQDTLPDDKKMQTKLMQAYNDMLANLYDAIKLLKYHFDLTKDKFGVHQRNNLFSAIKYDCNRDSRDENIVLFEQVCDICLMEYDFSYDEEYIRQLIKIKEYLGNKILEKSGETKQILNACLNKIEILLSKLSVFSQNKQIIYNYDFNPRIIKLEDPDKYPSEDYRNLFLKFIDPERLTYEQIQEWQKESHNTDVAMWKLAFLMRYYTKKTRSMNQIDVLLEIAERHHLEYVKSDIDRNLVNDYADRSFRNYMYNSRLSFILKSENTLSLSEIKKEISDIESLQNETFIFCYHPYQKIVEYICDKLDELLKANAINSDVEEYSKILKKCYKHLKDNYEWCKEHQPYLMQMRFNFSTIKDEKNNIDVFYPSSFCRPLRFAQLKGKIDNLDIRVSMLDYQVRHIDDHRGLILAKQRIETMERRNLENMGIFVSVTTFLVGLLTIFIGNTSASIFARMEYVFALGDILVMFVCIGYFLTTERFKDAKPWIFGFITFVCFVYMFLFVYKLVGAD